MKTIAQIIGKSEHEYEMDLFNLWWNYCKSKARNEAELQLLITNPPLNNWFIRELEVLQNQFLSDVELYKDNSYKSELLKIWVNSVLPIFTLRSLPLINAARKKTSTKPLYN